MIAIGLWLGTLWGRVALGASLVAALLVLRAWDVSRLEQKGAEKERVRVEVTGRKSDVKAQAVRRKVEAAPPAEVDAALRRYCRDCAP